MGPVISNPVDRETSGTIMARALDYQGLLLGTERFRKRCHDQIEAHSAVWCRIIRTSRVPLTIPKRLKMELVDATGVRTVK
jgi:hypothetical protein